MSALLADLSGLLGLDVVEVHRFAADPGCRNVRRSDPNYRPATPTSWAVTIRLPEGHWRHELSVWPGPRVSVTITSSTVRNPRRLTDFANGYRSAPLSRRLTADDGHRAIKIMHAIADTLERTDR